MALPYRALSEAQCNRHSSLFPALALLAGIQGGVTAWAVAGGPWFGNIHVFLNRYPFTAIPYLTAVWLLWRRRTLPISRAGVWAVIAVAVGLRALLLIHPPSLSDDWYRYLWEGRLALAGENPFAKAPDHPSLIHLRDQYWEGVGHKNYSAIYPPIFQFLFQAGAAISPTPRGFQILASLGEGLIFWALLGLLGRRGLSPGLLAVYAWNPVVIMEYAGNAHMDPWAIGFMLLAIDSLERGRERLSAGTLLLAANAKLLPWLLVPGWWRSAKQRPFLLKILPLTLLLYLPFIGAGSGLWKSLTQYGDKWVGNTLFYPVVEGLVGDPVLAHRLIPVAIILLVIILAARRTNLFQTARWVTGIGLLFAPTVYPWYLGWYLPFLAFAPEACWLYLSSVMPFIYANLPDYHAWGRWKEFPEIRGWEIFGFGALWAVARIIGTRKRQTTPGRSPNFFDF